MIKYFVKSLIYSEAIEIIKELKSENIPANISSNKVSIHCSSEQVETLYRICLKFNQTPYKNVKY